jgi:hypothetical protein
MREMQEKEKDAMKNCVNGCEKPVANPSIVICEDCQKKFRVRLIKMVEKMGKEKTKTTEPSNIRNKCLCKLMKGVHSVDDHK